MTNKNYVIVVCFVLSLFSCNSIINDPITNAPIDLECSYNSDVTLIDHNPDGVDYVADCLVEVSKGTISIEPGVIIEFKPSAGLEINSEGILIAKSTSGDPIIMQGQSPGTPTWRGIFINSFQANNIMEHVEILDAGDGESFMLFEEEHAAITVQGRFSMKNSLIKNSGSNGIVTEEITDDANFGYFEDNTIEDCTSYPIFISLNSAHEFDFQSCTFSENGRNMVGFQNYHRDRLYDDLVLKSLEVPYFMQSGIDLYAGLTLEAGVDLVMGNNSSIKISSDQVPFLNIQGSQSNRVTIRGNEAISGYWNGILIKTGNSKNIFENLDISDGGGNILGFNDSPANITLEEDGKLTIINSTSARSGSNCDLVISTFFGNDVDLTNQSPEIEVCTE